MTLFLSIMHVRRAVVFRYEEGYYGSCYPGFSEEPIVINLRLHVNRDPVRTYVHECLHIIFPKFPEKLIRATEKYVWLSLSAKQRFLISRKLYNREWRTK